MTSSGWSTELTGLCSNSLVPLESRRWTNEKMSRDFHRKLCTTVPPSSGHSHQNRINCMEIQEGHHRDDCLGIAKSARQQSSGSLSGQWIPVKSSLPLQLLGGRERESSQRSSIKSGTKATVDARFSRNALGGSRRMRSSAAGSCCISISQVTKTQRTGTYALGNTQLFFFRHFSLPALRQRATAMGRQQEETLLSAPVFDVMNSYPFVVNAQYFDPR